MKYYVIYNSDTEEYYGGPEGFLSDLDLFFTPEIQHAVWYKDTTKALSALSTIDLNPNIVEVMEIGIDFTGVIEKNETKQRA